MNISKKAIIFTIILGVILGCIFWGIRVGTDFCKKKLVTIVNTQLAQNVSGTITWKQCKLNLFTNTVIFEDISFFSDTYNLPLSAQRIRVRYSLIPFLISRKLFFPSIYLEGLQGKSSTSFSGDVDKSIAFKGIFFNKDLWRRILFKADKIFGKIYVRDGAWEISLPRMDRKIDFQQVGLSFYFSSQNVLAMQMHVPKIKVSGVGQNEWYSLPKAEFRLTENALCIDSFSLSSEPTREKISMHGRISYPFSEFPVIEGAYEGDLNAARIKVLFPHLPFHDSALVFSGQIRGDIRNPLVKGSIRLDKLSFDDERWPPIKDVRIGYIYKEKKITFNRFSLSLLSGKISGSGKVFSPERKFSVIASADKLKIAPLSPFFSSSSGAGVEKSFLTNIQEKYPLCGGKVSFEGEILQDNQVKGNGTIDLRFDSLQPSPEHWFSWQAELAVLKDKRVQFIGSKLQLGKDNFIRFAGGLDFEETENFEDFHFALQLADFSQVVGICPFLQEKNVGGNLSLRGEISGSFSDPHARGLLEWQKASFKKYRAQKVEGRLRYDKKHLFFSDFLLKQNQTHITMDGDISLPAGQGALQVKADPIYYNDLEQILSLHAPIVIEGKMVCRAEFTILPDTEKKFYGLGQITTGEWSIADKQRPFLKQHFDSVTSQFEVDTHIFHLFQTVGVRGRQKVLAELTIPNRRKDLDLKSFYQFTSKEFDLSMLDTIQSEKIPLEGKSSFHVQGQGRIGHGDWKWQVSVQQPEYKGFSWDQAVVTLFMQANDYKGEAEVGENVLSFKGNLENGISYQLAGQVSQFTIERDPSYFYSRDQDKEKKDNSAKISIDLFGQIEASGNLSNFRQSEGEFKVKEAHIHTPFHILSAKKPFTITYQKGLVFMPFNTFYGEKAHAQLSVKADWGKSLDISSDGTFIMDFLQKKYSNLTEPQGDVHFDLSLAGPLNEPQFSGTFRLSDGAFGLSQLKRRIEDIQADFSIDNNTVSIVNMSGKFDDGSFVLSGWLNLNTVGITSGDIKFNGENILLTYSKKDKFMVDGNLHWQGNRERSTLGGTINVREGIYNRNVGILQSLLTKRRKTEIDGKNLSALQPENIEWLNNLSYNIQVYIPQNVWVTSTFFNMEISTSQFAIKGNFFRPYPEGQIRTQNGNILLGGNKFQIMSGLLELTDPEQQSPSLDVSAVSDIDAYQITANIYGFVDDPQIRLSSTPYLPQSDILNMIALGISSHGRAGEGLVGQMATATSSLLADIFGQELTSASGIDLFRTMLLNKDLFQLDLFKLKVGEETGVVERITVGKDITKRLQLKYSIPASETEEEGRDIAEADYKLFDHIRLIGSQDDLGTYSLDLNFSLEF